RFGQHAPCESIRETMAAETSFVTTWVIAGFLAYELLVHFTGLNLAYYFLQLGALAPLLAVLVGFVPGCGPQILVTTLYLNGVVPLSCQLANAISNDGDALFPAIALTPKAAVVATLYSAIPALVLGYVAFSYGY
ncbi:MAG: putative manganese transporter, partial [Pseudomonadota bacterium]